MADPRSPRICACADPAHKSTDAAHTITPHLATGAGIAMGRAPSKALLIENLREFETLNSNANVPRQSWKQPRRVVVLDIAACRRIPTVERVETRNHIAHVPRRIAVPRKWEVASEQNVRGVGRFQ
jgi:hypothetical protein